MVSWVPGDTITPGSSVQTALLQISTTQDLLQEQTWGSGNVFAGIVAIVPQMLLGGATSSLSNWQTSLPVAQQAVADTVGVPVMHQIAQLQLLNSLLMPSIAQAELNAAALFIPWSASSGPLRPLLRRRRCSTPQKAERTGIRVVPLTMYAGTEPIVYISVDGGPRVPVLVDTGSSGLVISSSAVGSGLGTATGSGTGAYSGGLTYDYNTYNATVDFGNGVTTVPTAVNVVSPRTTPLSGTISTPPVWSGSSASAPIPWGRAPATRRRRCRVSSATASSSIRTSAFLCSAPTRCRRGSQSRARLTPICRFKWVTAARFR